MARQFRVYATMKQLAAQYQVTYGLIQVIVHDMHREKRDGVIYVGRLPRIDVEEFEKYLLERRERKENDIDTIC